MELTVTQLAKKFQHFVEQKESFYRRFVYIPPLNSILSNV
jgi:hypothetical protein